MSKHFRVNDNGGTFHEAPQADHHQRVVVALKSQNLNKPSDDALSSQALKFEEQFLSPNESKKIL